MNDRKCLNPYCENDREGIVIWCEWCNRSMTNEDRWYIIGMMDDRGYPYENEVLQRAHDMGRADRETS